ncbi:peptidoglycan-binding protein [Mastigocoleus sp. MO_188.B34]|uniref:peptidoglycan-binding domain-containing protein n=1 Tax=Mastigocoleus sp. MO_188.B34 TaxID=3036635 RepID=UPI0026098B7B|nr:peptidoglycan-binding protein [Mastigocoleus sp. MO_188.B34]MDJ0694274.1 peptidoglycan-binding protein [Mastigocoleus sp. MO_188.B34]
MSYATQTTIVRPTLTLGSTGDDVKDLQKVLNGTVADNTLVVDGIFGRATQEAVTVFQKQYGLTVDGIVGSQTWAVLDTIDIDENDLIFPPTIRLGSTGEDVEYLQRRLNGIGLGPVVVDGIFGVATEKEVKKFQKHYDLTIDGVVGPKTWVRLEVIDV